MRSKILEGHGIMYKLICKINNRQYIGSYFMTNTHESVKRSLEKRKLYHALNTCQNKHQNELTRDILNYGTPNFEIELVEDLGDISLHEMNARTTQFLHEYAITVGTFLYNKVPKYILSSSNDIPLYEYKYVEGDYEKSRNIDKFFSRNLYIITFNSGEVVEISGFQDYREFVKDKPSSQYVVRKILAEDLPDYMFDKEE